MGNGLGPTQEKIQALEIAKQVQGYNGTPPAPTLQLTSSNSGTVYTAFDYIGESEAKPQIIKPTSAAENLTGRINRAWLQIDKNILGGAAFNIRVHLYQSPFPIINGIDNDPATIDSVNGKYKIGVVDFDSFTAMNPSNGAPLEASAILLNPLFFQWQGVSGINIYTIWQSLAATQPNADTTYTLMLGCF